MGGKSDAPAPPDYIPPPPDNSALIAAFMGQIGALQESLVNMQAPQIQQLPKVVREPIVNWAEKNKQLLAKAKADYGVDKARKKGRTSTILTSPLLDDDETSTTSILT